MAPFIYLASQSPRRQELLKQLGVTVLPLIPDSSEDPESLEAIVAGETARHYVQRVTVLKAGAAVLRLRRHALPRAPILTADTTVAIGRTILGKPATSRDAVQMLGMLSGRQHRVLTAVAVTNGHRLVWSLSESSVTMRTLTVREIRAYVASGEPFGKAGGYAIQGRAAAFVTRIAGSFSGIMGLPLCETAALLARFKVRY
jgi:septum formation protein